MIRRSRGATIPTLGELIDAAAPPRRGRVIALRAAGCCGSLDEATQREWLVTDGLGGYAMGTVAGLRTRRYHGLLVVAVGGPARPDARASPRSTRCSSSATRAYRLATDEWADGAVDPRGHELLVSFELDRRRAPLALAGRRHRARARARDDPRPGRRRRRPPAGPRRPAGAPRAHRRSARGAASTASASRAATPAVEPTDRRLRLRGRLPGRRRRLARRAATWYRGVRCARGGGARAQRPRGRVGRRERSAPSSSRARRSR